MKKMNGIKSNSITVISRSNVRGTETGVVNWDTFSHKHTVKMGLVVSDNLFCSRKKYVYAYDKFTKKYEVWQTNDPVRRRDVLLYYGCVLWIIISSV
jgi:hypothetical protein